MYIDLLCVTQIQYREGMMKKERLFHWMQSKSFIPWIHLHIEMIPLILPG